MLRRTLRSIGSISANFSQLMLLAYFFLFTYALSQPIKIANRL